VKVESDMTPPNITSIVSAVTVVIVGAVMVALDALNCPTAVASIGVVLSTPMKPRVKPIAPSVGAGIVQAVKVALPRARYTAIF
jgi:hypothetical protein